MKKLKGYNTANSISKNYFKIYFFIFNLQSPFFCVSLPFLFVSLYLSYSVSFSLLSLPLPAFIIYLHLESIHLYLSCVIYKSNKSIRYRPIFFSKKNLMKISTTICSRRLDPFYIVSYHIKWVKTSLTNSISLHRQL